MSLEERFAELRRRNEAADLAGGRERIERQHKAGKKTARERLELPPRLPDLRVRRSAQRHGQRRR